VGALREDQARHLMLLLQQVEGTSGRDLGPPPTPDRLEKRPQPFGRPRTWIRLTPRGRQAYLGHSSRYRCIGCGHVWRQDTTAAAEPRAKSSRGGLRWALEGIVRSLLETGGFRHQLHPIVMSQ